MAVTETIQELLQGIDEAQYGRDMRQFIHKGIQKCYEEGSAGETDLEARDRLDEVEASISDLGLLYEMPYDTTVTATQNSLHLYVIPTIKIAIINGMIGFNSVPEIGSTLKKYIYNLPIPPITLWHPFFEFAGDYVNHSCLKQDRYPDDNASISGVIQTYSLDTSKYYRFDIVYPYTSLAEAYPLSSGTIIS